jgi:hypothetical protein
MKQAALSLKKETKKKRGNRTYIIFFVVCDILNGGNLVGHQKIELAFVIAPSSRINDFQKI